MKTIITIIIIGAVVVGGYFAIKSNRGADKSQVEDSTITAESQTEAKPNGKKMAFSEFIKQNGSYKCTVNQYVSDIETKGTTYISNGMIRGEYNAKVNGMDIDSTLIVRDGYTYSWSSIAPSMGFKAKVSSKSSVDANTGASGTYSFNAEQIGDYDCQPWTLDLSKFAIPTSVTFKEIGA